MLPPKISLGIVTYNHQDFIAECIESALAQTYSNFDIVIADDCSTDRTYDIAVEYQKKHPDIIKHVLRPDHNTGLAANMNSLLSNLDSNYIALFCGDDVMHPQKLERQMQLLLANPEASFCYTNLEWFHSKSGRKICNHYGWLQQPSDQLERILMDNCISTNTMLIRRSCLPEGGFDESLPCLHDYALVVDLCLKGKPVYTHELLARYRRHGGNITANNFFSNDRFLLLERLRKRFPQPKYQKALLYFEAVGHYGLIREYLQAGKRKQALGLLPRIFPYCFTSSKWLVRCCLIAKDFILA